MTKHSKNNTASSIFSYAEKKFASAHYGTKRQRLGNESMRQFDSCSLCLNKARDPLACSDGHLFCKECVYTDLLKQKKDIKRQKDKLEAMNKEVELEKERAKQAARERVLLEFEKGQKSLGAAPTAITTSGSGGDSDSVPVRTKRKFAFDSNAVEALAIEAEEIALKQIEKEQVEALRAKLPDFWLPSLTPTYSSIGVPQSLKDVNLQSTCRGGNPAHQISSKTLFPVKFSLYSGSSPDDKFVADKPQEICASCKKALSNSILMFFMKPCSHVVCKSCTDTLIRPSKQCTVCEQVLKDKDIVELKREGTGFAGGGMAESSRTGIAFQG